MRYRLPLEGSLRKKFDALDERFELRVLGTALPGSAGGDPRFRLFGPVRPRRLEGALFWAALPARVARELRSFRPAAVHAQSPYEGAAALLGRVLARRRAAVVVDVHGDWRTFSRLYGSPLRRLAGRVADAVAEAALRRADAVRPVSAYTAGLVRELGIEPAAVFPAFMDLEPFLARPPEPPPERPSALFVGVLELYKNVDGLAQAWRLAAPRVPGAALRVVGDGSRRAVVEALVRDLPGQTRWTPRLPPEEVARALDEATVLVLPSRSEGMGRVLVEALCRGRPVVGARVGGVSELVADEVDGLLVEPEPQAIADALVRVLTDPELAARLAAAARLRAAAVVAGADEFAGRLRALVDRVGPRA